MDLSSAESSERHGNLAYIALVVVTLIVAAVATSACTTTPPPGQLMTAQQIRAEVVGKQLSYLSGAYGGDLRYLPRGTMRYTAVSRSFGGTWRMQGDQMCTIIGSSLRAGRETCFDWYKTGPGEFRTSLGYKAWLKE